MSGIRLNQMRIFFLLLFISFGLIAQTNSGDDPVTSYHFMLGEQLEFKLSYGWFTVGKASLNIQDQFSDYEGEQCYNVVIKGSTAGLLGAFTHVDDVWGAYVRKSNLLPIHAYRNIEEGKYVREERTFFRHEEGKVEVLRYDPRKTERKPKRVYDIPNHANDLMSSYLSLRNRDFTLYNDGDTITIDTFYEDEFYHFKIVYRGIEELDSKVGKLAAHKISFLVPPSEIFPNEEGIVAYISADSNQLPLRIEAEMFFGTGYCELTSYRNIKYGPDFQ